MSDWLIKVFDASHGVPEAVYRPILVQRNPSPTEHSAVQVGTTKTAEAVNFSLSAQLESGSLEWDAYSNPSSRSIPDFSYDEATDTHTLQAVINNLDSGTTEEQDEATRLRERFSTSTDTNDGTEKYTVKSITEQRIWLKEYIHDHGNASDWQLFGPSWTHRVNLNEGCPIFITAADIEPDPDRPFEGGGRIQFQLGGRL